MLKLESFILFAFFLSVSGCADIPDETNIDEIVEEIETEIEEEKEELCRNGFQEEWEECDFFNFKSCSGYDESLIGPATCESCKWIVTGCTQSA